MRLSINGRVVKSYDVEVSTPRMVECLDGFQQLGACLTMVSVGKESISWESEPKEQDREILRDANERAAKILTEAETNAQKRLAQAEADAQEILAQAQTDLDRLQQEVRESVKAEVFPVAQAEGYREGKQAGEAEGKRLTEHAHRLFLLAERAVQEEYTKVEKDLLHLAIRIAERIVRSAIAVEPQRVMDIIQALTLLPLERQGWRLHVALDDAHWLEGNQLPCPWVMDESLSSGDCFLECQEGIFDGRLEAQLDKLEHTLREELEHGGVESIGPDCGTN